ncbi:MAG: hypothetical protein ACOX75_03740 [Lachnospiraceae bacterium]|jgi:energy-coupling factor transport system substrate-specific component
MANEIKTNGNTRKAGYFKAIDIAYMAIMVVLLEAGKRALDALPNIEVVSFMIIIFTLFFEWKVIPVTLVFATLECIYFGFGPWTVTYYYVWPILVVVVMLTRKIGNRNVFFYSILSGLFGLFFGALCAIYTLFVGGLKVMISWWIAGLMYDVVHCVGNFVICLILFHPVNKVLSKLRL